MRYTLLLILSILSLSVFSQRSEAIEIEIDEKLIPTEILESDTILDIEYSSKEGHYVLWIHPDSTYKPFKQEHFQYLSAGKSVYNRKTKTDHLNIFIETTDELGSYDIEKDDIKYKNIKFSELGNIDLAKVKFKRKIK